MQGDDSAGTPNARYLANAFVALGLYHHDGIPGTLKADPNVAREMFRYAASHYADPEAQYYLGGLHLRRAKARRRTPSKRRAGCDCPPTKASTTHRRCSAACCSKAKTSLGNPRSVCSGSSSPKTPPDRMRLGSRTCTAAR